MAFFEKNKVKIYYEVYGDTGPCLVFINGFTRPCQDFRMIARFFEGQGFRVLIFDNRGAGQTEYDTFTSLEQPADDLSTLLIELALESAHIVGFSMGGIIARCFANKYPGLLRSLTLVASPFDPSFISKKGRSFLGQTEEEIEKNFAVFVADDFYEKNKILFKTMARGTFKSLNTLYKKPLKIRAKQLLLQKIIFMRFHVQFLLFKSFMETKIALFL